MDELDDILTSIFKHEIPYYEFRSFQPEIDPQKECKYFPASSIIHSVQLFNKYYS